MRRNRHWIVSEFGECVCEYVCNDVIGDRMTGENDTNGNMGGAEDVFVGMGRYGCFCGGSAATVALVVIVDVVVVRIGSDRIGRYIIQ